MKNRKFSYTKAQLITIIVFVFDLILCLTILILPFIPIIDINIESAIIYDKYIEKISLFSFGAAIFLIVYIFIRWKHFISTPNLISTILRIGVIGSFIHLICGLFLIFIEVSSVGAFPIYLGPIYRYYGYLHLVSTLLFVAIFIYFKKYSIILSKKKSDALS